MPWGLDISIDRQGDEAIVTLTGTLDRATAHELASAVSRTAESAWRVVLDLREVTFMDLGGLKALVEVQTTARARRRDLKVIPGPPNVQRVFELTRTDDALCFMRQ
jgi:anti-anti-sigma factor